MPLAPVDGAPDPGGADCVACGRCCHHGPSTVHLLESDDARMGPLLLAEYTVLDRRPPGWRFLKNTGQRCAALDVSVPGRYPCAIYAQRPDDCRIVAPGSPACLEARRLGHLGASVVFAALALSLGCAATPYEARATYAPADAARVLAEHPARAWIVRGAERSELPAGARIEPAAAGFRVAFPRGQLGAHVRKLADGDAVVVDEQGRLIAIRSRAGTETRFAPGTASLPPNSDEVLIQQTDEITLAASDQVEVLTQYAPGDKVPGVGHVEEQRKIFPLVAGGVLLAITYGPAVYVGAASPLKADRVMLVPVLGPWIDLITRPKCTPDPGAGALPVDSCSGETVVKVGLVASGLGQALGVVLVGLGLPAEAVLVKDPAGSLRVGPFGARGEF